MVTNKIIILSIPTIDINLDILVLFWLLFLLLGLVIYHGVFEK